MRRTTALLAIGGLALAGALTATPAFATTPTDHYLLFAWEITSTNPANNFETPQDYVEHIETTLQNLDQFDPAIFLPGRCYQLDLYLDNIQSRALIGAQLLAPGNPTEPWPGGSYRPDFSRVFCVDDAIQPPDLSTPGSAESVDCASSTVTIANWHDVVTYAGDKHGYTAQPAVRVADPDITRTTTAVECPVAMLAYTGIDPDRKALLAITGSLFVGVALLLLFRRRIATWADGIWFRGYGAVTA